MNRSFEYMTNLQYKVNALTMRLEAFESGEKYVSMRSEFKAQLLTKDRQIRQLKNELADTHRQMVLVRNNWMQMAEEMEKTHAKELEKKGREISALLKKVLNAENARDGAKDKLTEKNRELYGALSELEEMMGKNQKLKAQINRNYENSSIPSSMKPNHKKILNNREKTGKKPGGQLGHKGHGRKKQTPTSLIHIPAPEKYTDNPAYRPTGKIITKPEYAGHE